MTASGTTFLKHSRHPDQMMVAPKANKSVIDQMA